ncbi:MAG: DUF3302 domain-containing protein [Chromatiaceae bacterium]|nr:DUF3302 domain-containing protein [Chromatiaceae bacterium]MCP5443922.1 DUF3302 domain-containing protein [Chromatiaceae bacterium]
MSLDYVALFLVIFVVVFIFYAIIAIHDIPYEIARHRNHPHQDAIHVAGWVSLFTLHVLWPFLWIWSTLYREDRGWGFGSVAQPAPEAAEADPALETVALNRKIEELARKITVLESKLRERENSKPEANE